MALDNRRGQGRVMCELSPIPPFVSFLAGDVGRPNTINIEGNLLHYLASTHSLQGLAHLDLGGGTCR